MDGLTLVREGAISQIRKTHAVVFAEPSRTIIAEVGLPRVQPSDVLVEIEHTSISIGTERWCLTDRLTVPGQSHLAFPHVPGYQAAGIVREVGPKVEGIQPGDRVFSRNCREPDCWTGSWWGGHVRFHVADHQAVIKLPRAVSTHEASSLLLAQVGFNGATKPQVSAGDVAVVIGAGLVGQYAAQVLRYRGAHVIITDLLASRLKKPPSTALTRSSTLSTGIYLASLA